jgi:GntR family transcriptional regulator
MPKIQQKGAEAPQPVTTSRDIGGLPAHQPKLEPLYAQVKALLVQRIASGSWKPGQMLPSEFELASTYNVSQGTMRKALINLEADRLIVRRQGRGTYVARHTRERALFHFFRMVDAGDRRQTPSSIVLSHRMIKARPDQAALLEVDPGTMLHAVVRVRQFGGIPAIFERIFIPVALMPRLILPKAAVMEDEMYVIYEESFGITVARASERLTAVPAGREEAIHLQVAPGVPLLQITRLARDVGGSCVELRVSCCNSALTRYAAEVS